MPRNRVLTSPTVSQSGTSRVNTVATGTPWLRLLRPRESQPVTMGLEIIPDHHVARSEHGGQLRFHKRERCRGVRRAVINAEFEFSVPMQGPRQREGLKLSVR